MNIKKVKDLCKGMIFKNYGQLCDFLGESVKTGKGKQYQLKEWKRFFDFKKEGNKIIISEKYNIAKEKEINRGIYKKYVEKLLLDLFCQKENLNKCIYRGTLNQILESIFAINSDYTKAQNGVSSMDKFKNTNIDLRYINEFYNITYPNLKNMIETALNGLKGKGLIWEKNMMVVKREDDIEVHELANDEEKNFVSSCIYLTLKDMDEKSLFEVYRKNKTKVFRAKLSNYLKKESNILYFYNSYGVWFSDKMVQEYGEELKDIVEQYILNEQKQIVGLKLNEIIRIEVIKNAKKREEKYKSSHTIYKDGEAFMFGEGIRSNEKYTKNMELLANSLIKREIDTV